MWSCAKVLKCNPLDDLREDLMRAHATLRVHQYDDRDPVAWERVHSTHKSRDATVMSNLLVPVKRPNFQAESILILFYLRTHSLGLEDVVHCELPVLQPRRLDHELHEV